MPSGHRTSPSSGCKTESATDAEQRLRERLSDVTTTLNQVTEEKEKLKLQLEQAKRRSSVSINPHGTVREPTAVQDLRKQVHDLQDKNEDSEDEVKQWKETYEAFKEKHNAMRRDYEDQIEVFRRENRRLEERNGILQKENDNVHIAYTATSSKSYNTSTTKLPERPKERPKERGPKEYNPEGGSGRGRDKEKKREKEDAKYTKRLSERFEPREREGRERDSRPPVTKTKRRDSYVEDWGPGVATPARGTSRSRQVPRNAANLEGLRSPIYSSGSGGSAIDDTEDGNYHPYPVQR